MSDLISGIPECTYCGTSASTRDHVPTRKLFPAPRPSDLITVPSCAGCNNRLSAEEEYFVHVMLTFREADSPEAREVREQLFAKERNPRRVRMALQMLSTMKPAAIRAPDGTLLGEGKTFDIDLERFDKVAEKIARGLWFTAYGKRLPEAQLVEVQLLLRPDAGHPDWDIVEALLKDGGGRNIGPDVFEYWIGHTPDAPDAGACLMLFFGAIAVLCVIVDPARLPPDKSSQPDKE